MASRLLREGTELFASQAAESFPAWGTQAKPLILSDNDMCESEPLLSFLGLGYHCVKHLNSVNLRLWDCGPLLIPFLRSGASGHFVLSFILHGQVDGKTLMIIDGMRFGSEGRLLGLAPLLLRLHAASFLLICMRRQSNKLYKSRKQHNTNTTLNALIPVFRSSTPQKETLAPHLPRVVPT